MDLIIGGAFQGKLEYAKEHFGIAESDVFRCERTAVIDPDARCIYGLEDYVYGCIKEGVEKRIYTDRNVKMAESIANFLSEDRSVFIVVGAAHLVLDKQNVIELLRSKGLKVERF